MNFIMCHSCGSTFDDRNEYCPLCNLPVRNNIEEYKGYWILRYGTEDGFRVDFGTMRSKLVATVEEARALIDLPVKWDAEEK